MLAAGVRCLGCEPPAAVSCEAEMIHAMYKRLRALLAKRVEMQLGQGECKEPCHFGNKSVVVWDPVIGLGTVLRQRGKIVRTMGRRAQGKVWLFAEEVLFLAERAQVVVLLGDQEIPAKTLYSVTISSNREQSKKRPFDDLVLLPCLACYWVYAHLRDLGYVVFRAFVQDATSQRCTTPAFWDNRLRQGVSAVSYEVYHSSSCVGELSSPAFYVLVTSYTTALPPIPTLLRTMTETCGVHLKVAVVSSDGTVLMFDVSSDMARLT